MNNAVAVMKTRHPAFASVNIAALFLAILWFYLFPASSQTQAKDCEQPEPVCAVRGAVFAISSFDPVASAVRIGPQTLVTSRHAVADEPGVTVFLANGQSLQGEVVPTDYPGDIILIAVPGLPSGTMMDITAVVQPEIGEDVYSVGVDVAKKAIRAFPPGSVLMPPAAGHLLARLHHTAYSQPGNSGGALVSATGELVGIIASGGEGRYEAVPTAALSDLIDRSGTTFNQASTALGTAVRDCTLILEDRRGDRAPLTNEEADRIEAACMGTGNRQYFDLAAEAYGASGFFGRSIAASEASIAQDPNALNARLTAVVTYHLAGWYEEELPHLRFLMKYIPDDPLVVRYGIQAGVWGGDKALAASAFERLKASNPNMASVAQKFIDNPPPRPARRDLPK
ncbi:serine protease [Hwanghaeella grinnelliae]|uniref:Serine protease n=1 Tax=Hwanghaeella grinnelliae TaxID=2500179 RepID=A0A437QTY7_9PROT|nr:serine protease [Hwanghaeella grinnelliae]RVU37975.1 serine protease [Hwanghaeella grinnelliae]